MGACASSRTAGEEAEVRTSSIVALTVVAVAIIAGSTVIVVSGHGDLTQLGQLFTLLVSGVVAVRLELVRAGTDQIRHQVNGRMTELIARVPPRDDQDDTEVQQ